MDRCPVCGYVENVKPQKLKNAMNRYYDAQSLAIIGVFNDDEKELTVKGRKLIIESVALPLIQKKEAEAKAKAAAEAAKK